MVTAHDAARRRPVPGVPLARPAPRPPLGRGRPRLALAPTDRSLLRIATGRVTPLDPGPVDAFTLDGDRVVFARGGRLWALALAGGAPTPLCPVSGPVGAIALEAIACAGDRLYLLGVTRGPLLGVLRRRSA